MSERTVLQRELGALADDLAARRQQILAAWHAALDEDRELTSFSNLSRAQFNDHIPAVLDAFEQRLRVAASVEESQLHALESAIAAAEHGLHRWQQGYDQRQTMREWGHLQQCLLSEFERYEASQPRLEPGMMVLARRALVRLCSDGVIESATRYVRLQQTEAAGKLRDLEQALVDLQALEHDRAEGWRQAAHDLRGSVGIISNASAVLNREIDEPVRARFSQILQRGVSSLHMLLSDLIDVARLEAGHERRRITQFDAARTLRNLCDTMRSAMVDGKLFLRAEGPESLPVAGDEAKVVRIAQNLMLNAFKATAQGGVRVLWEAAGERWLLSVQDTGPGFSRGSAAPLEGVLKLATEESHEVEANAAPAQTLHSQSSHRAPRALTGEGIGLSIVKRLCELLDAGLELETAPGEGTTFRVVFPRSYLETARD